MSFDGVLLPTPVLALATGVVPNDLCGSGRIRADMLIKEYATGAIDRDAGE